MNALQIGEGQGSNKSVDLQATPAVEYDQMDADTKQLLELFRLQLKPIEARQEEILDELKSHREQVHAMEVKSALSQDHIARYKTDLDQGLARIRKDLAENKAELEKKIRDRYKLLTPMFAALASVTLVLVGLFVRWLLMGGPS